MLLDRIDIESHGPLNRVTLGPFSQTLNAIVAATGSGKTALVRFLRDSLTGTTPAREGLSQSSGRVIWSAADGFYHCRRTPDGTAEGRRFVEFESRTTDNIGGSRFARESIVVDLPACVVDGIITDTVLTSVQRCVQAAIASGLDHASAGFNSSRDVEISELRREIAELERQIHSHTLHSQHASARPARAYDSFGMTPDMKRLRDRRAELSLEISAIDARRDWSAKADAELDHRRRKRELFATIADEIQRLQRHESDLKMRLADVDAKIEQMDDESSRAANRARIAKAYQGRVEQVEAHLARIRKVVREVRALGDHWFGGRKVTAQAGWLEQAIEDVANAADDLAHSHDPLPTPSDDCHHDLEITDRGWSAAYADLHSVDAPDAVSTIDVQRRLDAVCRLVDNLVGRCEEHQSERILPENHHPHSRGIERSRSSDWDHLAGAQRDHHESHSRGDREPMSSIDPTEAAERFEPTSSLDRAQRLLQEEHLYRAHSLNHSSEDVTWIAAVLNGVSQRLRGLAGRHAAYGSSNVDPLFHARRDENSFTDISNYGSTLDAPAQVAAVRRCERELVEVLRRLVNRRDVMRRRIAEVQNQPLSQSVTSESDSPSCDEDQHLYQWLVRDRIETSQRDAKQRVAVRERLSQQRIELAADLNRTSSRTIDRVAEAETIRIHLRSLPVVDRHDDDAALRDRLVAEINAIDKQLARPRIHPSILQRHAQSVTRLQSLTSQGVGMSGLSAAASEHLRKLSGGRMSSVSWQRLTQDSLPSQVMIDNRSENSCSATERFIAALAVRLAATDELARRGRALPLVIETPSLRHLFGEAANSELRSLLQTSIAALAEAAGRGRQILILTDDAVLADAAMRAGGSIHSIRGSIGSTRNSSQPVQTEHAAVSQSLFPAEQMFDVNRDFDLAWAETNGEDAPWRHSDRPADGPSDKVDFKGRAEAAELPFFLTGHSPVDQAPSIDVDQAERLRDIGVKCIEQLLLASPKELAASLGLDRVDAATVRRWQNECRLVCSVPKLRGFDARVLVGCGITHPRELAEVDPRTLVERVEAFMATDRGGRILRTGTDQEISRLTEWIQQGKGRTAAQSSAGGVGRFEPPGRSGARFAAARREHQQRDDSKRTPHLHQARPSAPREQRRPGRPETISSASTRWTEPYRETGFPRKSDSSHSDVPASLRASFYLNRSSDVETAPTIGPRMAERMHRIGVKTVDDLITRSADSIAAELKLAKVDAPLVRQWQQQATLVCRVPMLRGHDAQLLVAAGITEPERLAECDAAWLLDQIEPVARGREGKAILRGGKLPDLAEMQEWIRNAQQHRELMAA